MRNSKITKYLGIALLGASVLSGCANKNEIKSTTTEIEAIVEDAGFDKQSTYFVTINSNYGVKVLYFEYRGDYDPGLEAFAMLIKPEKSRLHFYTDYAYRPVLKAEVENIMVENCSGLETKTAENAVEENPAVQSESQGEAK